METHDINQLRIRTRQHELFASAQRKSWRKVDRRFAYLLLIQWIAMVAVALSTQPYSYDGSLRSMHPHVWAALGLGAAIFFGPLFFILRYPGEFVTRSVVTLAQVFTSSLLIHITNGRIESHFHIFGSLAILSFYRDYRVFVLATITVAVDHCVRGIIAPFYVFGVNAPLPWRWLEHSFWVAFESFFLIMKANYSRKESLELCRRNAELEILYESIERIVERRTEELKDSNRKLEVQRMRAAEQSQMASLGTMAAGVAHEINNPLSIVVTRLAQLNRTLRSGDVSIAKALNFIQIMDPQLQRIRSIVESLTIFSVKHEKLKYEKTEVSTLVQDVLNLYGEKLKLKNIDVRLAVDDFDLTVYCHRKQIVQVLLNLVQNSYEAMQDKQEKWLSIKAFREEDRVFLQISDNGPGIAADIINRILDPFFTTKDVGQGMGLGLSTARGFVEDHGGKLKLLNSDRTTFEFSLPYAASDLNEITIEEVV